MNTNFKKIVDLAYNTLFQNYKLDNLLKKDKNLFYQFLYGMVENSIDMFDGVLGDLSFHKEIIFNDNTLEEEVQYIFDRELNSKEIYILALGLSIGMFKRELDDTTIYSNHLSAKEFKEVGNAQNLKARQERLTAMQEELEQKITDYQISSININGMDFFSGGA